MEAQAIQDFILRKDRVIRALLPNVMFDGWSIASLRMACQAVGAKDHEIDVLFPDSMTECQAIGEEDYAIDVLFPGGVTDAVLHFIDLGDRQMTYDVTHKGFGTEKVREKIMEAVKIRLQPWAQDKDAIRLALAHLAMPQNSVLGTKTLFKTVDEIWYLCGDRSTDFNFYSKRALLAGVCSTTLLYWLNDHSENHEESWKFLEKRIEDVMRFGKLTGDIKKIGGMLPDPFPVLRAGRKAVEILARQSPKALKPKF